MSKLIYILFLLNFCLITQRAFSNSTKTPAVSSLTNFVWALKDYKKQSGGRYPTTWAEFNDITGDRYSAVIGNAQKYLDIENRYIFFKEPLAFMIQGEQVKVVMMATDAELEGARSIKLPDGTFQDRSIRFCIVERADGKLTSMGHSNKGLKRIFKEKGLDLNDYTKKRIFEPSVSSDSSHQNTDILTKPPSKTNSEYKTVKEDPQELTSKKWSKWLVGVAIAIFCGGFILWIKSKSSKVG